IGQRTVPDASAAREAARGALRDRPRDGPTRLVGFRAVRRKLLGRGAGLTARMIIVLLLIGMTLAVSFAGLASLFLILPGWWPLWTFVVAGLSLSVIVQYRSAEASLLKVAQARLVNEAAAP